MTSALIPACSTGCAALPVASVATEICCCCTTCLEVSMLPKPHERQLLLYLIEQLHDKRHHVDTKHDLTLDELFVIVVFV
uniref:CSON008770 protein n=1 Tax=Culicoides sonorensis TaxID=179676 RepID=A0A336MWZ4_CULSO